MTCSSLSVGMIRRERLVKWMNELLREPFDLSAWLAAFYSCIVMQFQRFKFWDWIREREEGWVKIWNFVLKALWKGRPTQLKQSPLLLNFFNVHLPPYTSPLIFHYFYFHLCPICFLILVFIYIRLLQLFFLSLLYIYKSRIEWKKFNIRLYITGSLKKSYIWFFVLILIYDLINENN